MGLGQCAELCPKVGFDPSKTTIAPLSDPFQDIKNPSLTDVEGVDIVLGKGIGKKKKTLFAMFSVSAMSGPNPISVISSRRASFSSCTRSLPSQFACVLPQIIRAGNAPQRSQTKIYPVQNWSVKKPIGAFLQTTAPVLDKIYGLMGGWFLSSTGLGSGTVIGGREFLSAPSLDKIISFKRIRAHKKSGGCQGEVLGGSPKSNCVMI